MRFLLVGLLMMLATSLLDAAGAKAIMASCWREFSPPKNQIGLWVSVDSMDGDVFEIRVLHGKESWTSEVCLYDNDPKKGKRFLNKFAGPNWAVGDEVSLAIKKKPDGPWLDVGKLKIGRMD